MTVTRGNMKSSVIRSSASVRVPSRTGEAQGKSCKNEVKKSWSVTQRLLSLSMNNENQKFICTQIFSYKLCVYFIVFQTITILRITFHTKMWTFSYAFPVTLQPSIWNNLDLCITVKSKMRLLDPQILRSRWIDVYDILIIILSPISPSISQKTTCFDNCHRIICKTLPAFFFRSRTKLVNLPLPTSIRFFLRISLAPINPNSASSKAIMKKPYGNNLMGKDYNFFINYDSVSFQKIFLVKPQQLTSAQA